MTPEQAVAVERYIVWMTLWQTSIAADLLCLGLPADLVSTAHLALTELTRTATLFTTAAAGLPLPAEVATTA